MCWVNSTKKSSRQMKAFSAKSAAAQPSVIHRSRTFCMFAVMDFDTIRLYVRQRIESPSDSRRYPRDSGLRDDCGHAGNPAATALRAPVTFAGTEQHTGSGAGSRLERGVDQRRSAHR